MTRRVPNEWFSLCTTKSPACPTVPHFALSSTYAPLLFFRSLISFVPPVPTPPSCLLSLVICHSLVTDQRFSCSSLGAKQFIPFLLYFLFHHPRLSLSLLPYFNFFPFFIFFFVRDENTRFVNIRFARLFRYF